MMKTTMLSCVRRKLGTRSNTTRLTIDWYSLMEYFVQALFEATTASTKFLQKCFIYRINNMYINVLYK